MKFLSGLFVGVCLSVGAILFVYSQMRNATHYDMLDSCSTTYEITIGVNHEQKEEWHYNSDSNGGNGRCIITFKDEKKANQCIENMRIALEEQK